MARKSSVKRRRTSRKRCASGYVRSRKTGQCVFATGHAGRKLNKRRAAKKRSHKRSGRPSPGQSATLFSVGHTARGQDGNVWKISKTVNGVKRWVRA